MTWRPPVHDPGRSLRAHATDADWRHGVTAIAARHGLPAATATPFASGSDVVWGVDDVVVKLTAPRWADEMAAEAAFLDGLDGRLPVATPGLVAHGTLEGWPYVVMTRVAGVAIGRVWPTLDAAARRDLATRIGETTRALHTTHVPGLPDDRLDATAWIAACRASLATRHTTATAPHLVAEVEAFVDAHLGSGAPEVPLHTELLHEHLLVDPEGRRVVGLIDFADSRVGPVPYELPALADFVFRGEPGLFDAFLDGYGWDEGRWQDGFAERVTAWGLLHRFGSLERMLGVVGAPTPTSLTDLAHRLVR